LFWVIFVCAFLSNEIWKRDEPVNISGFFVGTTYIFICCMFKPFFNEVYFKIVSMGSYLFKTS